MVPTSSCQEGLWMSSLPRLWEPGRPVDVFSQLGPWGPRQTSNSYFIKGLIGQLIGRHCESLKISLGPNMKMPLSFSTIVSKLHRYGTAFPWTLYCRGPGSAWTINYFLAQRRGMGIRHNSHDFIKRAFSWNPEFTSWKPSAFILQAAFIPKCKQRGKFISILLPR